MYIHVHTIRPNGPLGGKFLTVIVLPLGGIVSTKRFDSLRRRPLSLPEAQKNLQLDRSFLTN